MNEWPVGGLWLSWVSSHTAPEDSLCPQTPVHVVDGARQPLLKAGREAPQGPWIYSVWAAGHGMEPGLQVRAGPHFGKPHSFLPVCWKSPPPALPPASPLASGPAVWPAQPRLSLGFSAQILARDKSSHEGPAWVEPQKEHRPRGSLDYQCGGSQLRWGQSKAQAPAHRPWALEFYSDCHVADVSDQFLHPNYVWGSQVLVYQSHRTLLTVPFYS